MRNILVLKTTYIYSKISVVNYFSKNKAMHLKRMAFRPLEEKIRK